MKVKVTKTEQDFKPIDVLITLENRDEVLEMALRFNISLPVVNEKGDFGEGHAIRNNFSDVFFQVKDIYESLGK